MAAADWGTGVLETKSRDDMLARARMRERFIPYLMVETGERLDSCMSMREERAAAAKEDKVTSGCIAGFEQGGSFVRSRLSSCSSIFL